MSSETEFRLGHRPWLDGLRGVAILLVLAYHLGFATGGFIGVDLFFVLSGFLITCLLAQEWRQTGGLRLGPFYLRRLLRLAPALLLTILLFVLGAALWQPPHLRQLLRSIPIALCYLMNWPTLTGVTESWLGYTWSLSVEEQFYLLWPPLLLVLLRNAVPRRVILGLLLAGAVGAALLRAWLYSRLPAGNDPRFLASWYRIYMGLDTRGDALLLGCLVGLLASWGLLPCRRRFGRWLRTAALAALVCLGCCARGWPAAHPAYSFGLFSAVSVSCAVLLACMLAAPLPDVRRVLESPPLVFTGRISYGLYLLHIPLIHFLFAWKVGPSYPRNTVVVLALTYAAALASFYLVERPFLRLKDRLGRPAEPEAPPAVPRAA